jgi:hypothetical protein
VSKTAWPASADLQQFLYAGGLIGAATAVGQEAYLPFADACAAALGEWERRTNYAPFMADSAASARLFTPSGTRFLDLQGGIVTSPAVVVGYTPSSVGTTLSVGTDVLLRPQNANLRSRPWTWLEFIFVPTWTLPDTIQVTAKWGYCANGAIPEGAWLAVMKIAASMVYEQTIRSGGLKRLTEGDVTKEWGAATSQWGDDVNRAVAQYGRRSMA